MSDGVTHLQFVWFYVPAPQAGWELQHSIKSVRKYFQGEAEIIVIGANPGPWFTDTLIEVPRVGHEWGASLQPYFDTRNKWVIACEHPAIRPEFVWMMDDQFFVNPVTKERLEEPKADPFYKEPKTQYAHHMRLWMRLVIKSFQLCQKFGAKPYQYATHAPHYIVQKDMRWTLRNLPTGEIVLPEIAYNTLFHERPGSCFPFLQRIERPLTDHQLMDIEKKATVVNLTPNALTTQTKNWLQRRIG